jgi:hypothetical protein
LLQAEVERLADRRQPRALALFDVLDEWFHSRDFDCSRTLWMIGDGIDRSAPGSETLERYAEQAGASDPREAAHQLRILMIGATISAGCGDARAAARARSLAELVLDGRQR